MLCPLLERSDPCPREAGSCRLIFLPRGAAVGFWGLLTCCAQVLASEEDLYFGSLPVVATVSRLPQPLRDAPGSVTVIDREMIRASGARGISDLLRLVPGFQVTPLNTEAPRVVYHGLSDEEYSPRVQVLIDGRSQYSPLFRGGVNWNTLPVAIEDIERIEVVRGSNSAAFGSNAFLGVINIITQDASQARGASFGVNHGNQGVRDERVRLGGQVAGADVRLTVRQQSDWGYRFRPANPGDPVNIADDFRQRLVDLRADVPVGDRDELRFHSGHLENRLDTGRSDELLNTPRQMSQSHSYVQLGWRHSIAVDQELNVRVFHVEERVGDAYRASALGLPFSLDRGGSSRRDDIEFEHTLPLADRGRLVWGAGSRHDRASSRELYYRQGHVSRTTQRIFGNLEWRFSPLAVANLGATWENDSIGGTHLAPRLNLNLHPLAGQTLRVGASRAYRSPTLFESRGDERLVPDVSPFFARNYLAGRGIRSERIDAAELGYLGEFAALRTTVDLRLFHERIPNRILAAPRVLQSPNCEFNPTDSDFPAGCGHADYAVNGESVTLRGIEYQVRWQPFERTRIMLNQAFIDIGQHFRAFETSASASSLARAADRSLLSSPSHSTSLLWMQGLPGGFELTAIGHWIGAMKWTTNTRVPAYTRIDWRIAYPFKLAATRGEIAYVAQSANGEHAEFKPTRIIAERHWLSLRLDL